MELKYYFVSFPPPPPLFLEPYILQPEFSTLMVSFIGTWYGYTP